MSNKKKGILLPPAVGYSFKVIIELIKSNSISFKYLFRFFIIILINFINFPFRTYERRFINKRFKNDSIIQQDPIFILGHWRSGTTHLHNILCKDPQMGFATTYQSVFPDTLFNKLGRFLFLGFATLLIPGSRKGDNVTLGMELPQEEEFALGDKTPFSFYFFWMFPKGILQFYNKYIRFNNVKPKRFENWKSDYKLLIKKALKNTKKEIFLSKNPPNTGRIKVLLEMFPNAKFIHIHRNPIEVFLSTQNFYDKMLPHLQLQTITKAELDAHIIEIYKNLMQDYFDDKKLIPIGNLIDISFNDLEKNSLLVVNRIYDELNLPNFEIAQPKIEAYLLSMKNYTKNKHVISKKVLENLLTEWDFSMKKLNYDLPKNIEIQDE